MLKKKREWIKNVDRSIHFGSNREEKVFGSWEEGVGENTTDAKHAERLAQWKLDYAAATS